MKKSLVCFLSPRVLIACIFALLCLSSIGHASPQPSAENNVHFCLPLNLEDMRARDSIYAATKHALNLNVGESRTVRMIYFLPNDRSFRQEVVDSMKVTIRQIQIFYAEQMEARGQGRKTFRFETDVRGDPMIHRVDGQYPDSHYLDNTSLTVLDEIEQAFDVKKNIYFIVVDNSTDAIGTGGQRVAGIASYRGKNGGFALVPGGLSWVTAAHELGHTFGLSHDFRDGNYIMSYGPGWDRLSVCSAEFLAVHPYFNPSVEAQEVLSPTIELISQTGYPRGSTSVSIRLKVSDSDGLHQVILFAGESVKASGESVKACRGLNGARESVVEFDYDGIIPSVSVFSLGFDSVIQGLTSLSNPDVHPISIEAIDTEGNVSRTSFYLWEISPHYIATLEGHTDGIGSVTFSSTGAILASNSENDKNGTIKLWNMAKKENIATFHTVGRSSVAFSPDGATLAIGGLGEKTVRLWDITEKENIAVLENTGSVASLAFLPDRKTLASVSVFSSGLTVKLYDIMTKQNIATYSDISLRDVDYITSIMFSPDGTTLAWGGASLAGVGTIWLWDVSTRRNITTLEHAKGVGSVAFSPDGTILASGAEDNTVKLWDIATQTNIATFEGHKSLVGSVAFSPDGATLASGSYDNIRGSLNNTIKLWDVVTGQNIATYRHGGQGIFSLAFSPDGTTLASGASDGTAILWDVLGPRPKTLVQISGENQQGLVNAQLDNPFVVEVRDQNGNLLEGVQVIFTVTTGDGKLNGRFTVENRTTDANGRAQSTLTLGPNLGTNTVKAFVTGIVDKIEVSFNSEGVRTSNTPIIGGDYPTWHLPNAAIIRLGKGHISYGDRAVAFSPDGQRLAVASGIGVWIYDVATLRELALFTGHTSYIYSVAFSPDGTMLASGSNDQMVKLWNMDKGENIATFHTARSVSSVAFSPDGKILASGSGEWDGTVKLWDVTTGRNIATLLGRYTGFIYSVAFSPDGTMLASGLFDDTFMGKTVDLWNVETRQNIATFEGHTAFVNSIAFSPNGTTLASGSGDGTVKLWDMAMRTNTATFSGHRAGVKSVAFSPDGTMLASGSEDGTIKLWDMMMRTNIATLVRHTDAVNSLDFSPDGRILVSGAEDNTVNLWDVATQNITTLSGHTGSVNSLVFSPDGTTLASGSRNGTVIWDVATQNITALAESNIGDIQSIAFSPDGTTLALGLNSGTIKLWNVATGYNITTLAERMSSVTSVAFSLDGTTLASGSDKTVKLWDVAKKENIITLEGHTVNVTSVAFSPDGTTLASGSKDNTIILWNIPKRQNIATLRHSSFVEAVVFSPDGTTLASGSRDKTVKLWDVVTRENITTLSGHAYSVESVTFSSDGTTLVSGSNDGTVLVWDMSLYIAPQTPDPDFNGDGRVDLSDFLLFASQFGLSRGDEQYDAKYDLDGDGTIGFGDFLIFGRSFGKEGS
ncbi:MAG: hypothetical protein F4W91_01985 [Gemmatimonadetes bacterium]|nr:hypothetical protein [Gemmatimonadota bacterium]